MVRFSRAMVVLVTLLSFVSCGPTSSQSGSQTTTTPTTTPTTSPTTQDLSKLARVAVIYDRGKDQMYMNDNLEFPVSKMSQTEADFKSDVEKILQKNVVPTNPLVAVPPDYKLTLVKTVFVDNFGEIHIYHWSNYDIGRGKVYANAYALMVFDDGGTIAAGTFPNLTTDDAKTSSAALKHFLLNPSLVHELHNKGFKIPGEQDLYAALRALDPAIDVTKYPDLHI